MCPVDGAMCFKVSCDKMSPSCDILMTFGDIA